MNNEIYSEGSVGAGYQVKVDGVLQGQVFSSHTAAQQYGNQLTESYTIVPVTQTGQEILFG